MWKNKIARTCKIDHFKILWNLADAFFSRCFCSGWCYLLNETCLPHSFMHMYWAFHCVEYFSEKKNEIAWHYSLIVHCSIQRRIIVSKILVLKTLNLDSPTTACNEARLHKLMFTDIKGDHSKSLEIDQFLFVLDLWKAGKKRCLPFEHCFIIIKSTVEALKNRQAFFRFSCASTESLQHFN